MKKFLSFIAIMLICGYSFSQVKVISNGNVGIGTGSTTPAYKLHVVGNTYLNGNVGIGSTNFDVPLRVNGDMAATRLAVSNIGIGYAFANFDPAYRLKVGGAAQFLNGTNYLKISPSSTMDIGSNLGAIYFWESTTKFNKVFGGTYTTQSDKRLKENILPIENATEILKKLKTYSYYFISEPIETRKKDYGILAQEIEELLPDLVYTVQMEDSIETKLVNYTGFISFLIKGFNEQQSLIEQQQTEMEVLQKVVFSQESELIELKELRKTVKELQEIVSKCCANPKSLQTPVIPEESQQTIPEKAVLMQNTPNPFTSNTEISCNIPVIANHAFIYVYNLQGIELKSFPVTQGFNTITIHGSELPAGMYLYALVVDNEIIDTKRMILTK